MALTHQILLNKPQVAHRRDRQRGFCSVEACRRKHCRILPRVTRRIGASSLRGYRPGSGAFTNRRLTEYDLPHLGIIGAQAEGTEADDAVTGVATRPQRIKSLDIGDETM